MERTIIRAEDFRGAHYIVKIRAYDVIAACPISQSPIAPENRVVAAKQDDAVGHALQDSLVLDETRDIDYFGEVIGICVNAYKFATAELR